MYPPLPTSFHRVSAVLIFRWYSHNWVGPDWCYWYQWASNNSEVNQTWGDAAEENWAWWDHHFTTSTVYINTGSLICYLCPSLSPHSPLPSSPHLTPILIEERFWLLPKPSPSNHTTFIQITFWMSGMNMRSVYTRHCLCPHKAAEVACTYHW